MSLHLRARFNAAALAAFDAYMHRSYGKMKRSLLKDHPDVVVEVGAGAGSNLRYYRPGTKVIAVEPGEFMQQQLADRAKEYPVDLEIIGAGIESAGLPDESVDLVLTTLVMCTIPDPEAALESIYRMLCPGGRYVFLEHVAAEQGTFLRSVQETVHDPWHYLFEGCHTQRDIEGMLKRSSFEKLDIRKFDLKMPDIMPVKPQITGTAYKLPS